MLLPMAADAGVFLVGQVEPKTVLKEPLPPLLNGNSLFRDEVDRSADTCALGPQRPLWVDSVEKLLGRASPKSKRVRTRNLGQFFDSSPLNFTQ